MDKTEKMVLAAMKEKAPALHRQLANQGKLQSFLADQADQINDQISTLAVHLSSQRGMNQAKSLVEKAGIINTATLQATEIVLAEMLDFPQDETSPQKPDETTPSVMAT